MISLLISLLVSIPAEARFVTVVSSRKPVVASPPQMAMPIADGFVICGDTLDQSPRGDGCRIQKKLPCAGFCLSPNMEIETLSYRQFLQERVPAAEYLGVQLYYTAGGTRAIVYYANPAPKKSPKNASK